MPYNRSQHHDPSGDDKKFGKAVLNGLHRKDFKRTIRQDLQDLYYFYLDEDRRARLAAMNRFKRGIFRLTWLLKSLILKLTPVRRILLLVCLILFFYGDFYFLNIVTFLILLLILMLELKDKLLALDELKIGRAVQLALLPDRNPILPGWEIWLFTRPANDVGGDLVDYLHIGEDRLGVALGDVAGKGLGAALLMAKLQATLRALAPDSDSLPELGARMNGILCRDGLPSRFATLVYLELEPHSGLLHILNAGHMPPIALRGAALEKLPSVAPLLGILPEATYTEQNIDLQPGDLLLVYSDGLTEAYNNKGDFFGDERLLGFLPQLQGLSAQAAGDRLLAELESFVGDERRSDDLSLVLLKRLD